MWSEVPVVTSFIGGALIVIACVMLSFPGLFKKLQTKYIKYKRL